MQVSSACQAAQPETEKDPADAISNLLLICHSSFGNGNFESQEHGITHLFQLNWVSIKIRVRINGDCVCDLAITESKTAKRLSTYLTEAKFNGLWLRSASNECCHARSTMVTARLEMVGLIWLPILAPRIWRQILPSVINDCWGWPAQWWRGRQLWTWRCRLIFCI